MSATVHSTFDEKLTRLWTGPLPADSAWVIQFPTRATLGNGHISAGSNNQINRAWAIYSDPSCATMVPGSSGEGIATVYLPFSVGANMGGKPALEPNRNYWLRIENLPSGDFDPAMEADLTLPHAPPHH